MIEYLDFDNKNSLIKIICGIDKNEKKEYRHIKECQFINYQNY